LFPSQYIFVLANFAARFASLLWLGHFTDDNYGRPA